MGAVLETKTKAQLAKNIRIQLGKSEFFWDVYIAPIEEEVILGLDFMLFHKANVDLANYQIRIHGVSYGAKYRNDHGEAFQFSRVAVSKRTVVPP